MKIITKAAYENKVNEIMQSLLKESMDIINTYLNEHPDHTVYIAPALAPHLISRIGRNSAKISKEDVQADFLSYEHIYAYAHQGSKLIKAFDNGFGLINLNSYGHYLTNNYGAESYGEFLKLSLIEYQLTLGRDLSEFFYLIEDKDYKGVDSVEYVNTGRKPKDDLLNKIALIAIANEKYSQEQQVLILSECYAPNKLSLRHRIYAAESMCKILGIEKINVIKTKPHCYDIYFKSSKGFYYLVINGDERSTINYQAIHRAHHGIKYKNKLFFSGRHETPISALDIELSDEGFVLAEMIYLDDITTIFTQEKRDTIEHLKHLLFFKKYKPFSSQLKLQALIGLFLLVLWVSIPFR